MFFHKLRWLFLVAVLPGLAALVSIAYLSYRHERAAVAQHMLLTARTLSLVLDRDVLGLEKAAQGLAISTHSMLEQGDFVRFGRVAKDIVTGTGMADDFALTDGSGQEIVNTAVPDGTRLPRTRNMERVRRVFSTGRPYVSNLIFGTATRHQLISIDVPVVGHSKVIYDLAVGFLPVRLGRVLDAESLPPGWSAVVYDRNGVIAARSRLGRGVVGEKISIPGLRSGPRQGVLETVGSGASMVAYYRSGATGYSVAVEAPLSVLSQTVRGTFAWTAFAVAVGILISMLLAWRFSDRLLISIRNLSDAVDGAAAGREDVRLPSDGPHEIRSFARHLGHMLQVRQDAETAGKVERQRLNNILETLPAYILLLARDGHVVFANRVFRERFGESEGKHCRDIPLCGDSRCDHCDITSLLVEKTARDREWTAPDNRVYSVYDRCVADTEGNEVILEMGVDITKRKRAEEQVRQLMLEQRAMLDNEIVCIAKVRKQIIIWANRGFEKLFGYAEGELAGVPLRQLYFSREGCDELNILSGPVSRSAGHFRCEARFRRKDGLNIWAIIYSAILDREQGESLWVVSDVTERKRAEEELRIAAVAFESQEVGIMVTDTDNVFLRVNQAFTETTGYSAEELVGQTPSQLKSGRHDAAFYAEMWDSLKRTGSWQGEIWDRRKNGEIYPKWLAITVVKNGDGKVTHYVGTQVDITARKAAEEEIRSLAFFDPLTRLPNRRLLDDRLGQAMSAGRRSGRYGALMFLDLDDFKPLNDIHGHIVGDALLVEVAERLRNCVRETDTVARFGGDEFVVLLGQLGRNESEAAAEAISVAEKIRAELSDTYRLTSRPENGMETVIGYSCTVSIGLVLFQGQRYSKDDVLKWADAAMYRAKDTGRDRIYYQSSP